MRAVAGFRLVLTVAIPFTAHAQGSVPDTTIIRNTEVFHRSDLYVAAGFAAATIAMFPLDRHLASEARREDYVGSKDLGHARSAFRFLGGQAPAIISGSAFVVGRLTRHPAMAEIGLHTAEALLVATGVTNVLKGVIGRERPYVSADTNPHRFRAFRGWSSPDLASFPSGHSTAAFSMAAAVVAEVQEKWPRRTRIVAPVLYTLATGVGLSRMLDDRHWASDVVMGAAIGTFAGLKTVRFTHSHAGNRLDRALLGNSRLILEPGPRGFRVGDSISY